MRTRLSCHPDEGPFPEAPEDKPRMSRNHHLLSFPFQSRGTLFLLLSVFPLLQEGPALSPPPGPLPTLDGILSPGEWKDAEVVPLSDGAAAFVSSVEGGIAAGIRGPTPGLAHLALATGDTVRILHASAALGMVVYVREADGWVKVKDPVWEIRDPSLTTAAREARAEYLIRNGWVATTARMGKDTETEFLVRLPALGTGACRMAVVYLPIEPVGPPRVWPPTAKDEVASLPLLTGPMPTTLALEPSTWARIIVP